MIITALALATPAAASGGPAIPGGAFGGHGVTGPAGLPSSDYRYVTFNVGDRTIVERISTDTGIVTRTKYLDGAWALPAVTILGSASGLSADGRTLVLIRPEYRLRAQETTMRIVDPVTLRSIQRINLDTRASFDAISPDGSLLYLVQYADPRDPLDYRVRAYDWAAGEFQPGKIVDPSKPGEQMSGQPIARRMSPDGRWSYTLYSGGDETFIHALDTEGATAVCVDLDGINRADMYMLRLNVDPGSGQITVLDQGSPVALVDSQTFTVSEPAAPEIADSVADGTSDSGGLGWIGWAALGGGLALIAGLALLLRLRRRAPADVDEEVLERLVRMDASEREPVH
ncbi:MAG: hypothetical protein QOI10_2273 [Solirubrobacterales bacterium]|nr:hypothetical protein [Solirubrobacterales bacterium]